MADTGINRVKDPEINKALWESKNAGLITVLDRVQGQEIDPATLKGEKCLTIMFFRVISYFYTKYDNPDYIDQDAEDWLQGKIALENSAITSALQCRTFLKRLRENFSDYASCQYFESIFNFNPDYNRQVAYMKDSNNKIVFSLESYMNGAMNGNKLKSPASLKFAPDISKAVNALDESIDKDVYANVSPYSAEKNIR